MSPPVHHGGDDDLARQDAKVDAVRESSDYGPAGFAKDSGEGQRIGRDALYCLIYRVDWTSWSACGRKAGVRVTSRCVAYGGLLPRESQTQGS